MEKICRRHILLRKNWHCECNLNKLNGFHQNIQFTYESEKNNKLAFLDVLMIRNKDTIESTVYRKPTNSDIYLNWKFSPCSWKRGTLKTIIRRAYLIC